MVLKHNNCLSSSLVLNTSSHRFGFGADICSDNLQASIESTYHAHLAVHSQVTLKMPLLFKPSLLVEFLPYFFFVRVVLQFYHTKESWPTVDYAYLICVCYLLYFTCPVYRIASWCVICQLHAVLTLSKVPVVSFVRWQILNSIYFLKLRGSILRLKLSQKN